MILNKRREFTILLYDFAQDIIFETKDCYVDVLTRTGSIKRWVEENKKQITEKTSSTPKDWWQDQDQDEDLYPKKYQGTPMSKDGVTWANNFYYVKNGHSHTFENPQEKAKFFCGTCS